MGLLLDFIFYSEEASATFKSKYASVIPTFEVADECFSKNSIVRIFCKPISHVGRRMAVILTTGKDSLKLAKNLITKIKEVS